MNKLTIIGNITNDPELRTTQDGKSVCTFSVAVNRRRKQGEQQETDYFRVNAWGPKGESCAKYLKKGSKVAVDGPVSVHAYTRSDGNPGASMEVFANDVEFLPSGNKTDRETGYTVTNEEFPC